MWIRFQTGIVTQNRWRLHRWGADHYNPGMKPVIPPSQKTAERRRHPRIRALVDHPLFGLVIVLLVLLSVGLLVVETTVPLTPETAQMLQHITDGLTILFAVELVLRWTISSSNGRFLRNHWIDILAILPLLRVFRLSRIFQLVRLLRVFSLATVLQRRISLFGGAFEGWVIEYVILAGFLVFALLFGTVGFAQYEVAPGSTTHAPSEAFWRALFSLLSNQYADYPTTIGGRLVFAFLSLFSMTVFAMMTGTVSAVMIEKLKERAMQRQLNPEDLNQHIVICGFSAKVVIIVREFLEDERYLDRDIVVVSSQADIKDLRAEGLKIERISIVREDFTRIDSLHRAGIARADVAVVVSETGENRSTHDIDARTLLAALSIARLRPSIHICAELYHREYVDHLKMGGITNVVIQGEVSGSLLARIAMDEGLLPFFKDLLTPGEGNALLFVAPPTQLIGKSMREAVPLLHATERSLIVAVKSPNRELDINPIDHVIRSDDHLLVITPARGA